MNITGYKQSFRLLLIMLFFPIFTAGLDTFFWGSTVLGSPLSLEKGRPIPSVTVIGKDGEAVSLDALK